MRIALYVLAILALAYVVYAGASLYLTVQTSKKLIAAAEPFEKDAGEGFSVLVLGDSTAVGVGADAAEDTVAGRVSAYRGAALVENRARSGALTRAVATQAADAGRDRYDLILIQTGGNDIIRFTPAKRAADDLRAALRALPGAEKIVVIAPGDVGGATLFPFFMRPFYTRLNGRYHEAFARIAAEEGAIYVDFGDASATAVINERPDIYLAEDGLHPSSEGYRLWFETLRPAL